MLRAQKIGLFGLCTDLISCDDGIRKEPKTLAPGKKKKYTTLDLNSDSFLHSPAQITTHPSYVANFTNQQTKLLT